MVATVDQSAKKKEDLEREMSYLFTDLNVKAHYSLSQKDKTYLSYYTGKDEFS
ncbi:MAG: hypothetical protein ACI9JY_001219, partial [Saprospiraceae bacterium]